MTAVQTRPRISRLVQALLFVLVLATGIAAAILIGRGSLLFTLAPAVMALAALGLRTRAAFAAGFIAAAAAVSTTVAAAFALDPLHGGEWLRVGAFALAWAAVLAVIAQVRRSFRLAAAALVAAAVPAFITLAVPLVRSLDTVQLSSVYVTMRDGVKIAADVYLPRGAAKNSLPAILEQTRYFRRTELNWPYSLLFGGIRGGVRRYAGNGYAYVTVDARGSGASFGSRQQEWSDDEIHDGAQVVDWIIAQPWSTGRVGSTGVSYVGTTSEMLLANQHPAVKAIAPRFSLLDGYDDIAFPGGVHLSWFTDNWGSYNDALDRNALNEKLQGFQKKTVKGVAPVDGHEDLLVHAVAEHKNNYDVSTFVKSIIFRDDAAASGLTLARMSPFAKPAIAQSRTPIYSYSGWYDGAYQRAAAARFMSYDIPGSRLIIGAWDHGGRQNISPHDPPGTPVTRERPSPAGFQAGPPRTPVFDQTGELMRFFDLHLKGKDDGFGKEKPVRYYTMGEEAWKEADSWPPPAQSYTLHFAPNRALTETAPAADAAPDEYTVDLTSSTGTGSRWRSYFNTTGAKIGYPDRAEADKKLLVYNSAPLAGEMEITGHPAITLWVASSANDGQFFAYLEDVAPDGTVNYITEGLIRALHRAQNPAPYWHPAPSHSYLREHGWPLTPGEPAEISIALLPTSYLVRKGHSLRVALAGADVDQFAPLPGDAPHWRVYRDATHPSRITLPIVSDSARDSISATVVQ